MVGDGKVVGPASWSGIDSSPKFELRFDLRFLRWHSDEFENGVLRLASFLVMFDISMPLLETVEYVADREMFKLETHYEALLTMVDMRRSGLTYYRIVM